MSHLLAAIKKLDGQRAVSPAPPPPVEPARPTPSVVPGLKAWRIDPPQPLAGLHRASESTAAKEVATPAVAAQVLLVDAEAEPSPITESAGILAVPVSAPTSAVAEPTTKPAELTAALQSAFRRSATAVDAMGRKTIAARGTVWQVAPVPVPAGYRELAQRLLALAGSKQRRPRTVLVTAACEAARSALSLASLATVLAGDEKLLWIDTDSARPTPDAVSSRRGPDLGWLDVASGKASWDMAITATSLPGISYVGRGEHRASDDLANQNGTILEQAVLEPLSGEFPLVLVGGGMAGRGSRLARLSSATALVVAVGATTRGQIERALQSLRSAGELAPLFAAVGGQVF
ncbi:MAG TPA: hypothetical protein VMF30_00150 [Pirellulales bacterium]|nr:hypothetical protein [Pirellulales bacterium]